MSYYGGIPTKHQQRKDSVISQIMSRFYASGASPDLHSAKIALNKMSLRRLCKLLDLIEDMPFKYVEALSQVLFIH